LRESLVIFYFETRNLEEKQIMSMSFVRGSSAWALMTALVFGGGAVAQAQNNDGEAGGPVIQIGEADEGAEAPNIPAPNEGLVDLNVGAGVEQPEAPKYWIGLAGGKIMPDHVLRAHVDFPENVGLLVASVVPNSPAAKAGIKQYDILLRANESDLHEMEDLVNLVIDEGEKNGQIALEVLRKGDRETITLKPEERPADVPRPQLGGGGFGHGLGGNFAGQEVFPGQLLQEFGGRLPLEFRNFGPGVIVGGGGAGVAQLPNGVSISVNKEEGHPTKITVKRGDETWEVTGDDAESLKQLPEDLRPAVEQMLHGGGAMDLGFGGAGRGEMPELGDGRLRERMERMEQRMQKLMEQLENRQAAQPQGDEQTN
jgi:hypothetical protein